MADVKISGLPAATTPLAGTEVLPIVQSGTTKKVSVANLTAARDVAAASLAVDANSASTAVRITQTGAGNALTVEDSATPDSTPFVILADGSVGIQNSAPRAPLAFAATVGSAGDAGKIRLFDDGASNIYGLGISSGQLDIRAGTGGGVGFFTDGANQRAVITSTGEVGIGTASPISYGKLHVYQGTAGGTAALFDNPNAGINYVAFRSGATGGNYSTQLLFQNNSNTQLGIVASTADASIYVVAGTSGGVYVSSGATSWSAVSDERKKTDLKPITDAAAKVDQLRAVTGRYKTDAETVSRAFLIAQDVQKVLPEAVDEQNTDEPVLGLRYTDVIPLLVAAIQELKAELDAVKKSVEA